MLNALENYRKLLERVDALCKGIEESLGEQIRCGPGCSSCCTSISIFPVEAAAMAASMNSLSPEEAESVRQQLHNHTDRDCCPLLSRDHCLLYAARPVVCRTHGLPIIYTEAGERKIDYCPHNLAGSETLSGSSIIDLDMLNPLLVAVNAHYLSICGIDKLSERLTISESLHSKFFN